MGVQHLRNLWCSENWYTVPPRGLDKRLKAQGATQVELGVDAENESAAFRLYERLGYRTFSIDTWYRKWIPLSALAIRRIKSLDVMDKRARPAIPAGRTWPDRSSQTCQAGSAVFPPHYEPSA